ncbi:MAG: serine/threonine-protein kinase, partial [Bryobacterales bacterium]|nr:serine/threonine-protein kinase [Bryobacterales bacterium]
MALNVGEVVGDYQVVGILGAGGMGKVYKVRNTISDRVEALKILLPNLEADPELADRFLREIKVQASLDHPNIAALHTAQRVGNQLLMFMEFVEGESLESVLQRGPLPAAYGVGYISQVAAALAYAHARGVIHRDIKPANMMLTPDGTVKLMDFGIAKAAADRSLTQAGHTVGSLYYMSPEQINGAQNLDARSDLYSLGVALYELVTGRRPFQGESDYSIMAAHLQSNPVPPIQIDPSLPAPLNQIILTAIAKDPAQRFQSADAFRAALESVQGQMGSYAPAPAYASPPAEPARQGSSRRLLYMIAGSLATIAVLIVAATQIPKWRAARAGSEQAPAAVTAPVAT